MICSKCGTNVAHDAGYCPKCGQTVKRSGGHTEKRLLEAVLPWEEKRLMGILGAVGGAIVGGLILFQLMSFSTAYWVSTIGGAILAVTTLGGYWRLGGRLSLLGKSVSIALILFTGWLADWIGYAMWYHYTHSYIQNFWDSMIGVADYIFGDPAVNAAYLFGLLFLYEGCVIAAAVILVVHKRVSAV